MLVSPAVRTAGTELQGAFADMQSVITDADVLLQPSLLIHVRSKKFQESLTELASYIPWKFLLSTAFPSFWKLPQLLKKSNVATRLSYKNSRTFSLHRVQLEIHTTGLWSLDTRRPSLRSREETISESRASFKHRPVRSTSPQRHKAYGESPVTSDV